MKKVSKNQYGRSEGLLIPFVSSDFFLFSYSTVVTNHIHVLYMNCALFSLSSTELGLQPCGGFTQGSS